MSRQQLFELAYYLIVLGIPAAIVGGILWAAPWRRAWPVRKSP